MIFIHHRSFTLSFLSTCFFLTCCTVVMIDSCCSSPTKPFNSNILHRILLYQLLVLLFINDLINNTYYPIHYSFQQNLSDNFQPVPYLCGLSIISVWGKADLGMFSASKLSSFNNQLYTPFYTTILASKILNWSLFYVKTYKILTEYFKVQDVLCCLHITWPTCKKLTQKLTLYTSLVRPRMKNTSYLVLRRLLQRSTHQCILNSIKGY